MFNKAILAAALLSVGAITAGTAASAAEIGVRSTWGSVDRHINHATFVNEAKTWTEGTEQSSGFVAGIDADGFSASYTNSSESFAEAGFGAIVNLDTDGTIRRGNIFNRTEVVDLATTGSISGGGGFLAESTDTDRLRVDGSLTVGGSEYSREGTYGSYNYSREDGSYTEDSNRGFSELSTFSR